MLDLEEVRFSIFSRPNTIGANYELLKLWKAIGKLTSADLLH